MTRTVLYFALVAVLAVGTVQGAPIPSGEGFVSDSKGNIVVARLERDALRSIASAGGGKYSELTTGSTTVSPWAAVEGGEFLRKEDALGERWKDSGPWFLLILLPLVAFSFRRGLLFVLPLRYRSLLKIFHHTLHYLRTFSTLFYLITFVCSIQCSKSSNRS